MISYLGGSQGVSDASKKVVDFLNSGSIVAQVLLSIIIIVVIKQTRLTIFFQPRLDLREFTRIYTFS